MLVIISAIAATVLSWIGCAITANYIYSKHHPLTKNELEEQVNKLINKTKGDK